MGGPTVWSLIGEEGAVQQEREHITRGSTLAQRTPASLPPSAVTAPARVSPLAQLDVSCLTAKFKPLAVHDTFVRFEGKSCVKGLDREKIEIINRSNGYTASIFFSGADHYQTDLIQLKAGENEIQIRYPSAQGFKEEILRVTSSSI